MPTENLPACITNTNGTFSATIKVNLGKDVRISNTDGRFATGVNQKLVNLPLVKLTPVVQLDLQISLQSLKSNNSVRCFLRSIVFR
jgi:hypothetical protein